jgi:hypothetical protein
MVRKAPNSTWGDGLVFDNHHFSGPHAVYQSADPARRVSLGTFMTRLTRRRAGGDKLDQSLISDCLYTPAIEYQRIHGVRRTWVLMDGVKHDAAALYEASDQIVRYPVFRTRLKRLEGRGRLTPETLSQAASLAEAEWISFHGGGRRTGYVYEGEDYPALVGQKFTSITAFLRTIDRYQDRGTVWDRLKKGWPIDSALSEPVLPATERSGLIYRLTRLSTDQVYVGLTISAVEVRWKQHLINAQRGSTTALARALRADGERGFTTDIIETGLNWDELGEREKHWISVLDCATPKGLNSSRGGQIGGARRKPVEIDGEMFPSQREAWIVLGARYGVAPHVIQRRHSESRALAGRAREHSDHPEAGTNLWRRWKGMHKTTAKKTRSGAIDPRWNAYDSFAADVRPTFKPGLELVRLDDAEPWGPGNFQWISRGQRVAHTHGKTLIVGGVTYDSVEALSAATGIRASTLRNRLSRGMSPDEAITSPIGPTSRKGRDAVIFEGAAYSSLSEAAKAAAEKYGVTFDVARDRLRRNRGFGDAVG